MERHWTAEGGYNIRDLGGYPTRDGYTTRWNTLIRSGGLDKLTPSGQQQLLDYGVNTIIDLREGWELKNYPNPFALSTVIQFVHLPFIRSDPERDAAWKAFEATDPGMHALYRKTLENCQPQVGTIITAIAESEGCTLFHCYAGKDRTGMIAALILSAMGVDDEVVAEDYAQTDAHIEHLKQQWRQQARNKGLDPARFERENGAQAETMQSLLSTMSEQYGDVMGYLAQCGVTSDHIARLKVRFIG